MTGKVSLIHEPHEQLIDCSHVPTSDRSLRTFHWKTKDCRLVRLHDARLVWNALVNHELSQRILIVASNCADVIVSVSSVDPRRRVAQLTYSSRRLHGGYCSRLIDAQSLRIELVCIYGDLRNISSRLLGLDAYRWSKHIVHDPSHRYAQQCLFLCRLFPDRTKVGEVGEGCLYGS